MSESAGEKTEQPTAKKLEEALKKGQFARSGEIQTVFVMMAALSALSFYGNEMWRVMRDNLIKSLAHLHDTPVSLHAMQDMSISFVMTLGHSVLPIMGATVTGGLLAGAIQTRFRIASEALQANWGRLNPMEGFKRVFSAKAGVPTALGMIKLSVIGGLSYGVIKDVMDDPIFHSSVEVARIAEFLAQSSFRIVSRVGYSLIAVAAADYGYQVYRTQKDMMMTKEEVKEDSKNAEGNQQVKSQQRRRAKAVSKRKMLAEVPKADVVLVNPTHIAIALRYDRKTMKAPKIVAKGIRMNAQRIREIAEQHQIPIMENKPLARLMFKYGKVGGEIPAQLYAAVAEVLAWVYRVNAYRYYREQSL